MQEPIVALIYDFDQTLSPKNMEDYAFFPGIGMKADDFWAECASFARAHHMDGILTYMYLMLQKSEGKMRFTREMLCAQGRDIDFFPGVETWFERINAIGHIFGVNVEHYIISSGLSEIIEGSAIGKYFTAVFAGSFCYDDSGVAVWPATAVNYTSKTQYLFRINKGIFDVTEDHELNAYTPKYKRRIPFSNMIYVGDGLTDVPCMKMCKQKGGYAIAVQSPDKTNIADDLLLQGRADFSVPADYSEGSEIEKVVAMLLRRIRASHEMTQFNAAQLQRAYKNHHEAYEPEVDMRGGLVAEDSVE